MSTIYRLDQDPNRPTQVTYAVLMLYVLVTVEIAVFVIQIVVFYINHQGVYTLGGALFGSFLLLVGYLLMYVVARKIAEGKNWARWLLAIGFAFNIFRNIFSGPSIFSGDAILGIVTAVDLIVTALAVVLLFQQSSSAWFKSLSKPVGEEVAVADEKQIVENESDLTIKPESGGNSRQNAKIWLIVCQLILFLLVFPWFFMLIIAMNAGWPSAIGEYGLSLGSISFDLLMIYPIVAVPFSIAAWMLYERRQYMQAAIVAIAPLLLLFLELFFWLINSDSMGSS